LIDLQMFGATFGIGMELPPLPPLATNLPTRRAVLYYSISPHGERAVSNCDRFVLQFWPKFHLLFTPTTLPLNQISLSLPQRHAK